jgi:hypothetical protein
VERRNLELLPARLAHDLVVDSDQMVAELREFGAVALIRPGRQAIFLHAPDPPHVVFIGAMAARARVARGSRFVFVGKEGAFV